MTIIAGSLSVILLALTSTAALAQGADGQAFSHLHPLLGFGLIAVAATVVGYLLIWYVVGREPARGVVIPRYEPPQGVTPAAARYLRRMGYDHKTFTAALLSLASKGIILIQERDGCYEIRRNDKKMRAQDPSIQPVDADEVPEEEACIALSLLRNLHTMVLSDSAAPMIKNAMYDHKRALEHKYKNKLFRDNRPFIYLGIGFSTIITMLAAVRIIAESGDRNVDLAVAGIIVYGAAIAFISSLLVNIWKRGFRQIAEDIKMLAVLARLFIPMIVMGGVSWNFLFNGIGLGFIALLMILGAINFFFACQMNRMTPEGRRLHDEVEGFRLYLQATESDDQPKKTPQLYQSYLPYAIALDVGQAWGKRFAGIIGKMERIEDASQGWLSYADDSYSGLSFFGEIILRR